MFTACCTCAHAGIESSLGVDVQMPIEEMLPNDDGISVPLPTYTVLAGPVDSVGAV